MNKEDWKNSVPGPTREQPVNMVNWAQRENLDEKSELERIWWEGFNSEIKEENPYAIYDDEDIHERVRKHTTDPKITAWLAGHETCWRTLENHLAEIYQQNEGGLNTDEVKKFFGVPRKSFAELQEHARDDYRSVARLQIKFLLQHGLLDITKMRELIKEGKLVYPRYEHW